MDDKVKSLIEALIDELGDEAMSAAADAIINESRPRVAEEAQRYADERRKYADAVKALVEENERLDNENYRLHAVLHELYHAWQRGAGWLTADLTKNLTELGVIEELSERDDEPTYLYEEESE